MRKIVSGLIMLIFLAPGMLTLAFKIKPANGTWTGTVYIRADGSIDPPDAPIKTYNKVTYTLADNITSFADGIVIERGYITIDGAGYTLQGATTGVGIVLSYVMGVKVRNINIIGFMYGIKLFYAYSNTISGNNIINNQYAGICLDCSSSNIISGNNITVNGYGILCESSNSNIINGNNIANNGNGVWFYNSLNNILRENRLVNDGMFVAFSYGNVVEDNLVNGKPLVYLEGVSDITVGNAGQIILVNCNCITIKNLNLSNTDTGIELFMTDNIIISGNNLTNNSVGIWVLSSNNIISGNNVANNSWGIFLDGSRNNIISGNNVTDNDIGIRLLFSLGNIISGNNLKNNWCGITLDFYSENNLVEGNNIVNNGCGIEFLQSSHNNIYHNNFINNTRQVSDGYANIWDNGYPSGGNYWSDQNHDECADHYSGPYQNETGSDGIVDTPYVIDADDRDRYPLMKPWAPVHDVAIIKVVPSKTVVGQGCSLKINVTVVNQGDLTEVFSLAVYANTMAVNQIQTALTNGNFIIITFTWDTVGFVKGNYTLWAYVWPVPGETDKTDNTFIDGWVVVAMVGDVAGIGTFPYTLPDGKVDMKDVAVVSRQFGIHHPNPKYVPNYDINSDGKNDMKDVAIASKQFGKTDP